MTACPACGPNGRCAIHRGVEVREDTVAAVLAMHERRVTELITHNNVLEEKMRAEKRRADAAETALLALAKVSGQRAIIKLREPA